MQLLTSETTNLTKEFTVLKHVKNCHEVLAKHYPGWAWGVGVSEDGSMTDIRNFNISGNRGFRLHTQNLNGDSLRKMVIKAGGEILERASISRAAFSEEKYTELEVGRKGGIIHDVS